MDIKITITNINRDNVREAEAYAKEKGLQPFHHHSSQYHSIREGEYVVDLKHIFNNQYNVSNEYGSFRVFEYNRVYNHNGTGLLGYGYYISSGIEDIREYQKRVKECNYCGKQYIDSQQKYCDNCLGSELLSEDNYPLLRLTNIMDKPSTKPLPKYMIKKIKEAHKNKLISRENSRYMDAVVQAKVDLKNNEKEHKFKTLLINNGFGYKELDNLIFYTHKQKFTFGWRESIQPSKRPILLARLEAIGVNLEEVEVC